MKRGHSSTSATKIASRWDLNSSYAFRIFYKRCIHTVSVRAHIYTLIYTDVLKQETKSTHIEIERYLKFEFA
jgi:hypothetical protein